MNDLPDTRVVKKMSVVMTSGTLIVCRLISNTFL